MKPDFVVLRPAQTRLGSLPGLDEPQEMRTCPVCGELIRVADPDYCGKCEAEVQRYLELAADWDEHSSDVDPGRAR